MPKTALRRALRALVAVVALAGPAAAEDLILDIGKGLQTRAAGQVVKAALGPGATLVDSPQGRYAAPGKQGPTLILPVPDKLWKPAGTLAFRMRLSRTMRFNPKKGRLLAELVKCPLFTLKLAEWRKHVILFTQMAFAGKPTKANRRAVNGRLYWSHLKGGKWYNFAFTWNAKTGRIDVYLNGAIQQEIRLGRLWQKWPPPENPSGPLQLGGVIAPGTPKEVKIDIANVRLYDRFMNGKQMAAALEGLPNFPLTGEGLWDLPGSLDLKPYKLSLVYQADFSKPLSVIAEDKLFKDGKRTPPPKGVQWVLDGPGRAWTEKGRCIVRSDKLKKGSPHLVLWNTREFPKNFLLEFGMSPINSRIGLTIIFFNARGPKGESPFDPIMPRRNGLFRTYHHAPFNCYHLSYWATNPGSPEDGGILRRTTNLRKNSGFFMPAAGIDRIGGAGPGPHTVRLLKVGNKIRMETRGRMALSFDDDGKTYGPVWDHPGWIGLRQMGHTRQVTYTSFKVWKAEKK